ncbi:MAG: hypothetical protein ACRD15_22010, partial [Vicinamibacterales bacterium]
MFIFYYAVLSEVSPPTALSPFAAAALTGANPFKTMLLTWKYTLPAFVVPFVFTVSPGGAGVLLQGPPSTIVFAVLTAIPGVAMLALAFGGWVRAALTPVERGVLGIAGLLLFHASLPGVSLGATSAVVVLILHFNRHRAPGATLARR